MKKLAIFLLILPFVLQSCQKFEMGTDSIFEDIDLMSVKGGERDGHACYEIQFPLTVIMSDGSEITGDSKEDLRSAIKEWYQDGKKREKGKMKIKFPIEVKFRGEVMTVEKQETLDRIKKACGYGKDWDGKGDGKGDGTDKAPCVTFVYPLSVEMPNGDVLTFIDPADHKEKLRAWHADHPDARSRGELVFPVFINFKEKEYKVESAEQLKRFYNACKGKDGDKERKLCFEFVYPMSFTMPDGSLLEIEGADQKERAIKRWFEAHPDAEKKRPEMVFPIKIKYPPTERGERGRVIELASKQQLERAIKGCN